MAVVGTMIQLTVTAFEEVTVGGWEALEFLTAIFRVREEKIIYFEKYSPLPS